MPLYHFICTGCGTGTRRLLDSNVLWGLVCKLCSQPLKRDPKPPTLQVMEQLDNGTMSKRVERLANAEELYHQRAVNDPQRKK